jgi:hypothetical protein
VDLNLALGALLVFVGLSDFAIARFMTKLPESVRRRLNVGGMAMVVFGALLLLRVVRLIRG